MISIGRSRSLAAASLAIVLASSGCGSTAPTSPPATAANASGVPSDRAGPTSAAASGAPASTPAAAQDDIPPGLLPDASPPPLPEPTLDDPFAIGEALYDPGRVADGVVSLLAAMGVSIDGAEPDAAIHLSEPEVRGLISMAADDLTADPEGSLPYTLEDLHAGLAPFLPGVSARDLALEYASAYEREPDALVPQLLLGQPIDVDLPLTRVHLWLLFADGFVLPSGDRTASLDVRVVESRARWGTAAHVTTQLTPPPGMDPADLAILLLRLQTAAFGLGFAIVPDAVMAHEGHGGTGRSTSFTAGTFGGPGMPQALAPYGRMSGMLPFELTIRTTDPGIWRSHGTMSAAFDRPQRVALTTRATFRPKREDADGRGEQVWDIADIWATARAADLVASVYDLPFASSVLARLVPGEVATPKVDVALLWHADEGLYIDLTNTFDVDLGLQPIVGIGDAAAEGTDGAAGFLPRRDVDIYRGTLMSFSEVTVDCQFLGEHIHETIEARQSLDVFAQVRPGGSHDPGMDVITSGAFGPDDAHLTFYPAAAPVGSDGRCVKPIWSPGGGPLGRTNLTYRWFNDSRWTDPNLGYTIGLPDKEQSIIYDDLRLSREALSGPGGISGVHSVWSVQVTKVGH